MHSLTVVAYCRLSKEDGDDAVSSSVVNQKKIIEEYAQSNNMSIKEYYIDDGHSGYTMNRPSFNRLKDDLNNDKVDIIITKDLSRIGRHDAKVQLFLENILESGKRVIALGDNYDSYNTQSHDMVGIQTWINEKYIRDISTKIRNSISAMQKDGRFVSGVPYGYCMDPFQKGAYHIDETCARYVKEIFEMYLNGMGIRAIAIDLTQRNIPTGSMIEQQRFERQGRTYKRHVSSKWAPNYVMQILKNDFYIGTLTLGKTKKRSINGKPVKQPEENHYVFEDAHEPIIDKKTFQLVQETIFERTKNKFRGKRVKGRDNLYAGVLYCADCGDRLTSTKNCSNTRYVCKTYNINGTSFCSSHSILENEITCALTYFLEHCRDNLAESIKDLDNLIKYNDNKNSNGDIIKMLENDIKRVELELRVLLEQKMRETMKNPLMAETIDEMYSKMVNEKYVQINSLKTQLQDQRSNILQEDDITKGLNSAMAIFNDIIEGNKITKRQITTIVNKIVVYEDGGLDIFLKGNLHELCTNYVQMKHTNKGKILKVTIDYIKHNQERITKNRAWEYVKLKGCRIGYDNYIKIFAILIDEGYIKRDEKYKKAYILTVPFERLEKDFENHIVGKQLTWVTNNNVTLEMVISICKWCRGVNHHQSNKRYLF